MIRIDDRGVRSVGLTWLQMRSVLRDLGQVIGNLCAPRKKVLAPHVYLVMMKRFMSLSYKDWLMHASSILKYFFRSGCCTALCRR
jgi:hypothetical protein